MSQVEEQFKAAFGALTDKTFVAQAKWFLNGFFDELWQPDNDKEAEYIWKCVQMCQELCKLNPGAGELDEFQAHVFLEKLGQTVTVVDLREKLKLIDLDFNKRVALIEFLIFHYKKTVKEVVNSPQGDNKEEMKKAQEMVEQSQAAFDEVARQLEQQKQALAEQKAAEEASRAAESEAKEAASIAKQKEISAKQAANIASQKAAEAKAAADLAMQKAEESKDAEINALNKAAESKAASDVAKSAEDAATAAAAEQRAALQELQKVESEHAAKIAELEKKSQEGGVVSRGRAVAELEQLKSNDPLPLRRAKINQEAAVRRFEKARLLAEEKAAAAAAAANASEQAANQASASRVEAEKAAQASSYAAGQADYAAQAAAQAAHSASLSAAAASAAAATAAAALAESEAKTKECEAIALTLEAAVEDAQTKVQAALDFLQEVKKRPGQSYGDLWFMTRELIEKQKYLPQSKRQHIVFRKD